MKEGFVYIMTNKPDGTLYIGITSDLLARIYQHKNKIFKGFSAKYNLDKLVYFEHHLDIAEATNRERQIKNWRREWKINLIIKDNSKWKDLSREIGYGADSNTITAHPELDSGSFRKDPETSSGYAEIIK